VAEVLQLRGVGQFAGPRVLFSGIDLTLSAGQRLGLVGANGSGKSTLLKILAGAEKAAEGSRTHGSHLRVALLDQEPVLDTESTLLDFVTDRLACEPGVPPGQDSQVVARRALSQAGLEDPQAVIASLSGGWARRLALIAEIATAPDLLILDEPTNHLDLDGIQWLEQRLCSLRSALVMVSHDRRFLEAVCTRMAEIDPRHEGGFFACSGSYSDFLQQREQAFSDLRGREASLNSQLGEEIRYLRQGPKARTSKNATRVARAHENIAELDRVRRLNREQELQAGFAATGRKTRRLLVAEGLAARPGGQDCIRDLDLVLSPGRRIGLVGANGSGKTTLLRTLLGERQPDAGEIRRAPDLRVVYFDQAREQIDAADTVRKALSPEGDTVVVGSRQIHVKSWARQLLFRDEQLDQPVRTLSGGERARLLIARLMRTPADVLLLDEPTNDLDIPTLEALEQRLLEFEGAVVLVTHDRFLMDRVCTSLLALDGDGKGNGVTRELADLAQWEASRQDGAAGATEKGSASKSRSGKSRKPAGSQADAGERTPGKHDERPARAQAKLSYNEKRELDAMEEAVLTAEARVESLQERAGTESAGAQLHSIYAELNEAQAEVERLYERWAELDARA